MWFNSYYGNLKILVSLFIKCSWKWRKPNLSSQFHLALDFFAVNSDECYVEFTFEEGFLNFSVHNHRLPRNAGNLDFNSVLE